MRRNSSSAICAGIEESQTRSSQLREKQCLCVFFEVLTLMCGCAASQTWLTQPCSAKHESSNNCKPNLSGHEGCLHCNSWMQELEEQANTQGPQQLRFMLFFFRVGYFWPWWFPIFYESTFILRPTVESLGGWLRCLLKLGWPGKEPREPGSWCCIGEIWWCNSCRIGVIKEPDRLQKCCQEA